MDGGTGLLRPLVTHVAAILPAHQPTMKEIEVRIHSHDGQEPRVIAINEGATIEDLLRKVSPEGHAALYLVIGDEEHRREHRERIADTGIKHGQDVHCHPHLIHYRVDDEPQETTTHILTPTEIMEKAKVDPKTHYLIRLIGEKDQESYKDRPDAKIHMHEGMRFITASLGPTPVS